MLLNILKKFFAYERKKSEKKSQAGLIKDEEIDEIPDEVAKEFLTKLPVE